MADNAYTAQSISGYNASPPADDDTTASSNQVEWQKHLDKIGGPVKTLAEGINTAALALGAASINTGAGQKNTVGGSIGYTTSELTISGGSITPTATNHSVDTESDAGADDLSTLATGAVNDRAVVALRLENASRVVTAKNASGNINLANNTDVVLNLEVPLVLQRNGASWEEISRPIQDLETTATPTFAGVNLGDDNLDHYDEGTWTPIFAGGTVAGTQTYSKQEGIYTRIGNLVVASCRVRLTAFDGATDGIMLLGGLPFTASSNPPCAGVVGQHSGITLNVGGGYYQLGVSLQAGQSALNIQESGSAVSVANIGDSDMSNTSLMTCTISYRTS